jgi:hypothetical protein
MMGGIKIDPIIPVNPSAEIQKDKNQEHNNLVGISSFEQMLRQAQQEQKARSEKVEENKEEKPKEISQEAYQQASLQYSAYLMDRLINRSNKKDEEKK